MELLNEIVPFMSWAIGSLLLTAALLVGVLNWWCVSHADRYPTKEARRGFKYTATMYITNVGCVLAFGAFIAMLIVGANESVPSTLVTTIVVAMCVGYVLFLSGLPLTVHYQGPVQPKSEVIRK